MPRKKKSPLVELVDDDYAADIEEIDTDDYAYAIDSMAAQMKPRATTSRCIANNRGGTKRRFEDDDLALEKAEGRRKRPAKTTINNQNCTFSKIFLSFNSECSDF